MVKSAATLKGASHVFKRAMVAPRSAIVRMDCFANSLMLQFVWKVIALKPGEFAPSITKKELIVMTDWNPQVTKVLKVEPHPNADLLDIATVWDYPVVCKRDEYQVDQLVGYLPIDTIVPDTEQFHFLSPKQVEKYEEDGEVKTRVLGPKFPVGSIPEKYRIIKARRLRDVYSMGMLVSVPDGLQENDSLIEPLNLKKWDEPEEEEKFSIAKGQGPNAEPPPKGWAIPYYDIDGIRKFLSCLVPGEQVCFSEKLHGANFSACHDGERLWVKSRQHYKRRDEDDPWWKVALRYDLETKLAQFPNLVFFGEMIGQVKGYRYDSVIANGELQSTVHFFDVFDLATKRYLDYQKRVETIQAVGLSPVPELYRGPWTTKEEMFAYAEGQSLLNSKHIREGLVINTLEERFEPRLNRRMQLKLISEAYALSK